MKQALVIGAGNFGRHLICALREGGYTVDVLEKELIPKRMLRELGCRYIRNNAWNLAAISGLSIPDYEVCYVCINGNPQMNLHVIQDLSHAGAAQIVVLVSGEQDAIPYLAAGATKTVCPEQVASQTLVRETTVQNGAVFG